MAEEREPNGGGRPSRAMGAGGAPIAVARAKAGQGRKRVEPAPTTPDPIEIAMEAEASGEAPEGVARRVLLKQEALIGWQIASERAGVVVRLLTAAAGLAVAMALGLMAWDAHQARGFRNTSWCRGRRAASCCSPSSPA